MTFTWYYIFNLVEFEALDLVSKTYDLILENIGESSFLVTKGNMVGITYDDVFICLEMNDANPFIFGSNAIYKDADDNVFFGIANES